MPQHDGLWSQPRLVLMLVQINTRCRARTEQHTRKEQQSNGGRQPEIVSNLGRIRAVCRETQRDPCDPENEEGSVSEDADSDYFGCWDREGGKIRWEERLEEKVESEAGVQKRGD